MVIAIQSSLCWPKISTCASNIPKIRSMKNLLTLFPKRDLVKFIQNGFMKPPVDAVGLRVTHLRSVCSISFNAR